ncbi:MAG: hypothetical protein CMC96_03660 [Flavobacteriales bacterium]|mgnify:CR=1|nr:hypothetical protein [Flavobacteriales bacterium]|tara:strand:+ start:347 stop:811 length:465 start_codon:yes stop_codon:yes gene_type:complete
MCIRIKNVSYSYRLVNSIISNWAFVWLILVSLLIIFSEYSKLLYVIVILFLYYVYIKIKESKVYINEIRVLDNKYIKIDYFLRDSKKESIEIELSKLKIRFFDSGFGLSSLTSSKLVFLTDNKVLLKQFAVGYWNKEKMKEVVKLLKKNTHSRK